MPNPKKRRPAAPAGAYMTHEEFTKLIESIPVPIDRPLGQKGTWVPHLSQNELAELLDVSASTITNYRYGRTRAPSRLRPVLELIRDQIAADIPLRDVAKALEQRRKQMGIRQKPKKTPRF
jgi:DNA-binding XRE family transcriptional regulator